MDRFKLIALWAVITGAMFALRAVFVIDDAQHGGLGVGALFMVAGVVGIYAGIQLWREGMFAKPATAVYAALWVGTRVVHTLPSRRVPWLTIALGVIIVSALFSGSREDDTLEPVASEDPPPSVESHDGAAEQGHAADGRRDGHE